MAEAPTSPLKVWLDRDGALRAALAAHRVTPGLRGVLLDAEGPHFSFGASVEEHLAERCAAMLGALQAALDTHRASPGLRGVLLDAEGPHFSFGASVEEHLAERCAAMLAGLHALVIAMVEFPLPILVAVRGQCLGGGLELALACGPIFAAPEAQFGQPEIKLGVFAPAASCLLGWRVSAVAAEDLLWSGRSVAAPQALALGLVQALADDPEAAALAYYDENLAPRSAAALACAVTAARAPRVRELRQRLAEVERLYLDRLMKTRDANEGLAAFIGRRTPHWEHC